MKIKGILKIMGIILLSLLIVFVIMVLFGIYSEILGRNSDPTPIIPEIKRGEFPFKLVYEINGEQIVVEDAVICEYDGIGWNKGTGKYIKWKSSFASGIKSPNNSNSLLIDEENELYAAVGGSRYYMGEAIKQPFSDTTTPHSLNFHVYRIQKSSFGGISTPTITEDELLERYNIKIISFEPSPPIENSFN